MIQVMRTAAAVVFIVAAGLIQGSWTNRWGTSAEQAALVARYESIPLQIGDWKGTPFELPPEDRAMAGATAFFGAVYTNATRSTSVTVLLLGGLPGKISTHTPDVCYHGAGFNLSAPEEFTYRYGGGESHAGFQTSAATREGTNPSVLRIYWTWNNAKGWAAPQSPRWTFASDPVLSKLYVTRETWGKVVDPANDPATDFLAVFLPELDRHVFASK